MNPGHHPGPVVACAAYAGGYRVANVALERGIWP